MMILMCSYPDLMNISSRWTGLLKLLSNGEERWFFWLTLAMALTNRWKENGLSR